MKNMFFNIMKDYLWNCGSPVKVRIAEHYLSSSKNIMEDSLSGKFKKKLLVPIYDFFFNSTFFLDRFHCILNQIPVSIYFEPVKPNL